MKKLLSLLLCLAMVLSFAACGSVNCVTESGSANGGTAPTSLKFSAESYSVAIDGYKELSKELTVEPAGAKVNFSVSDTAVATINKKGEVTGVKSGVVTVTVASDDGSIKAECKVNVVGYGTVSAGVNFSDSNTEDFPISNKRVESVEKNPDPQALIVLIPKNLPAGTDVSAAVINRYYAADKDGNLVPSEGFARNDEGFFVVESNGCFIAKTTVTSDGTNIAYKISNVPEGEYYGLIVSGRYHYKNYKDYSKRDTLGEFSATNFAKFFTTEQINDIVSIIGEREYHVDEVVVKHGEDTHFAYEFSIVPEFGFNVF